MTAFNNTKRISGWKTVHLKKDLLGISSGLVLFTCYNHIKTQVTPQKDNIASTSGPLVQKGTRENITRMAVLETCQLQCTLLIPDDNTTKNRDNV
jgi:hypothetical protein